MLPRFFCIAARFGNHEITEKSCTSFVTIDTKLCKGMVHLQVIDQVVSKVFLVMCLESTHSRPTSIITDMLETVVLFLQIADSQRNMPYYSYLFSLVFTSYLPMQKWEKMFLSVSSVVISPPVISARWCRHERSSSQSRSVGSWACKP